MKWLSIDTDIFNDGKIKRLRREYNSDGWLVYSYILAQIAGDIDMDNSDNGYFEIADGDNPSKALAWEINLPDDKVENILELLAELNLIDPEKWEKGQIYIPKLLERSQTKSFLRKQEGGRKGGISKAQGSNKDSHKDASRSPSTDKDIDKDKDKETTKNNTSASMEEIREIINYLNDKADRSFKPSSQKTKEKIRARFNEDFDLEDFKNVIDTKVADWGEDDEMKKYLRPRTLFSNKFEDYLNEPIPTKDNDGGTNRRHSTVTEEDREAWS